MNQFLKKSKRTTLFCIHVEAITATPEDKRMKVKRKCRYTGDIVPRKNKTNRMYVKMKRERKRM
jgi:hypothetical protein